MQAAPRRSRASDPDPVVLRTWAYGRVGSTLVLCSEGKDGPHDEDLDGWVARLAIADFDKLLIHSCGAQMSARDRSRIAHFWRTSGRPQPPFAVLTDSALARAVMTGMGWLLRDAKIAGFAQHEVAAALQWLASDAPEQDVRALIAALRAALLTRAASQTLPRVRLDHEP